MNRLIIFTCLFLISVISCRTTDELDFIDVRIKSIEQEYSKNNSKEYLATEIFGLYELGKNHLSRDTSGMIYTKAGALAEKHKLNVLSSALTTLGIIYSINEQDVNENTYQVSKILTEKNYLKEADLLLNILVTESPGTLQADKAAKVLKTNFFAPEEYMVGLFDDNARPENMNVLVRNAIIYAKALSGQERAAFFLYSAAERARGLADIHGAMLVYDLVSSSFKDSPYGALSVFISGFLSDTSLKNPVMAEYYYSEFIKSFPEHHLADDAKFLLENLGKKDEEIIRDIKVVSSDSVDIK